MDTPFNIAIGIALIIGGSVMSFYGWVFLMNYFK